MMEPKPAILMVDDYAPNRAILARRFERCGYIITEADCGFRALELIHQQSFDLALLDVMMPDLNGLEVLKRIRQKHCPISLPVIMVTGNSDSEDIAEALAAGANDYLTKPVDFTVALARINTQLGRKRAEEEIRKANELLRETNENLERRISDRTTELVRANQQLRSEIATRERSQAEALYLADHDALTGLGNRVLFRWQLNQALRHLHRSRETLAILFIDLDGFKFINDTLGHSVGDALLKCIAVRLRECLRETDAIARLGGDEFAIIQMAEEQPKSAQRLAGRLIDAIAMPSFVEGQHLVVGASIGIAVASPDKLEPDELLRSADLAMYRAKADGRGVYRFFGPEMDAQAQARRTMELDLRRSIRENGFELYYQPIVNLESGRVSGFEALLRWRHPLRGLVPPLEFIPLAEETGMIIPLGQWVLRQACAEAAGWPDNIAVAVNLSPIQFKYNGLLPAIFDALAASGLPPSRLELEITESVLLNKTEANLTFLNKLRDRGVRISLDDFGTGYSSLGYLRSFRFDKIKIDKLFIDDLAKKRSGLAIVRAIADIGTSFGITTTAEGVETEDQLRFLRQEGYTEVQGFLYGRPSLASEIPFITARIAQTNRTTAFGQNSVGDRQRKPLPLVIR